MWKDPRFLSLVDDRAPKLVRRKRTPLRRCHAFDKGLADVIPVVARETVGGIQVGNPVSIGWRALAALSESNGAAVA